MMKKKPLNTPTTYNACMQDNTSTKSPRELVHDLVHPLVGAIGEEHGARVGVLRVGEPGAVVLLLHLSLLVPVTCFVVVVRWGQ